jgi:hypothetical protein
MKILYLLAFLLPLAFGVNTDPTVSFLSLDPRDQPVNISQDNTEDIQDVILCSHEVYGECRTSHLENGQCDPECANPACQFIDVVDCADLFIS